MILEDLAFTIIGRKKLIVSENHRVIVTHNGQILQILSAGKHHIYSRDTQLEHHDINASGVLTSPLENALLRTTPKLVEQHLLVLHTRSDQVKIILRNAIVERIMQPSSTLVLWKDAGPFDVKEHINEAEKEIAPELAQELMRAGLSDFLTSFEVPEGYAGMMFADGALKRRLPAGLHSFWNFNAKLSVSLVDLRLRAHELSGQEILTKDRVSLRVNISAEYSVADPKRALTKVHDYQEALHRSLQFAFRKTLGALTLDELLASKVSVDAKAADDVRKDMAEIGIKVGEIALKDVILPGEMHEILNQVVAAQKEAEANIIRRREETNATRSLLNTAKVMADNPIMLRLKELEAIESIAGKVDQLNIHNGTQGLMGDLVRLSSSDTKGQ